MDGALLLVLCVLFFVTGFLAVALYVSWEQAQHYQSTLHSRHPQWRETGIHKILDSLTVSKSLQFDSELTGNEEIDKELEQILALGLRDFFESWYHSRISPDPVCSQEAIRLAGHVIREVSSASREVDYLAFFIETLMDDFMDHLKGFKVAFAASHVAKISGQSSSLWISELEKEFFRNESLEDPWRKVCCEKDSRAAYLRRLSEIMLCILLPKEEFSSPALQCLLTDVLVWKVWSPLLKKLAAPNFINATFVSLCKENTLNSDSFMAALNDGANETEIRALRYQITSLISHLQKTGVTETDEQKKKTLESILATAKEVLNSKSVPADVPSNNLISLSATIPDFVIQSEGANKHCVFNVKVSCKHSHVSVTERWVISRRYRDFHDLHLTLRGQIDNFPSDLILPTLPSFNKLEKQRLEARRAQLAAYLHKVTSEDFLSANINVLGTVIMFLSEGEYTRNSTELQRKADNLLGPLKRRATSTLDALKAGQGSKVSPALVKKQVSVESPKPLLEEDEDSLPVDIIIILLDELFDLRADNQWLRRQLPSLLKSLAGDALSRKMVSYSDWFVSPEQVAGYLRDLRTSMWPNGRPAATKPKQNSEILALRSLLARAKLIGSIPDELKRFVGAETTCKGMARLFGMFQSEALNTRLLLLLLEGLLDTLLPNRNLKQTFLTMRVEISRSGRH